MLGRLVRFLPRELFQLSPLVKPHETTPTANKRESEKKRLLPGRGDDLVIATNNRKADPEVSEFTEERPVRASTERTFELLETFEEFWRPRVLPHVVYETKRPKLRLLGLRRRAAPSPPALGQSDFEDDLNDPDAAREGAS